ncbi:hypothetical protein LTR97_012894 [Elasticomyces elasticus]|uniref:Uncharacterized protein n=1 Tax=Elasticomyces elasticus TaxID=574655 RepID=A0AAN7ZQ86_9PEZI|nr:hypothetical protein LTR97_012894 [Elasticomyces elasticus]
MRVLVSIVAFAALGVASPLEVRQAATFIPPPLCTSSVSSFYKGYSCLKTLGTSSASAYCSQRFITTATATGFTNTFTDITTTSTVNVTGTLTSTTTSLVSTITSSFNTTTTVFSCPSSTASSTDSVSSSSTVASVGTTTAGTLAKVKRQTTAPITPPRCFSTDVYPRARTICLACYGVTSGSVTTVYTSTRTYSNVDTITTTNLVVPTSTVTAVATKNVTSTATVLTAYPLPTGNFLINYIEASILGIDTYFASAQPLFNGTGIEFSQGSLDDFRFDNDTRVLRDVTRSDNLANQPLEAVLELLFLMNATRASTPGTPQCYVCGNATEGGRTSFGCDYPDATGNVTNPGTDVWATCGDYLSLGPAASFSNQDIPVDCKIRNLFLTLRSQATNT